MNDVTTTVSPLTRISGCRSEVKAEDKLCRLMDEHERALQRFAGPLLGDADLALDCVQDTFLRAHESLGRGRMVDKRWLFAVAHNRAMDEFRQRRRLRARFPSLIAASLEGPSDTGIAVRQAMDELPRQQREVLYLFLVGGFSTEEMARLLGTTGPAVRQRLYRARRQFRHVYGDSNYA